MRMQAISKIFVLENKILALIVVDSFVFQIQKCK